MHSSFQVEALFVNFHQKSFGTKGKCRDFIRSPRYTEEVPELRTTTFSSTMLLAALSVCLLVGVATMRGAEMFKAKVAASTYVAPPPAERPSAGGASWQQEMMLLGLATSTESGVSDGTDPVDMIAPEVLGQLIGAYQGLQQAGTYSSSTAAAAAELIAPNVRANIVYDAYTSADLKADPDASYERMLTYRSDMQTALKPLLNNTTAEYSLYASYLATGDKSYLRTLQESAENYEKAARAAAEITVPADIVDTHLLILNAMLEFSTTLKELAAHADDPIASVALLRNYNDAETGVVQSFDKLAQYERMKQP
jgi:hypothetical protein